MEDKSGKAIMFLVYATCREHAEDTINVADAGDSGTVYPFIPGCQML